MVKDFIARRFTSFRFSWSFFSLFLSVFTFSIVLVDRYPFLNLELIIPSVLMGFVLFSVILDKSGFRQSTNYSESEKNPMMVELCNNVKEIKKVVKK